MGIDRVFDVSFKNTKANVPFVFGKLVEETGELARALNQPERCDEPAINEVIDIINVSVDMFTKLAIIELSKSGVEPTVQLIRDLFNEISAQKVDKWVKAANIKE